MRKLNWLAPLLVLGSAATIMMAQEQPAPRPHGMMGQAIMDSEMMARMDSMDARLDRLVAKMNAATGSGKTTAIVNVVGELVEQHKAARRHMVQRMQVMMRPGGMMEMMGDGMPGMGDAPGMQGIQGMLQSMQGMMRGMQGTRPDSAPVAPDSVDHAKHHPDQ